ncbi:hypothetical protein V425_04225 [Lactococcus lactis RTB018]|uniref:Anti-bacteriophage protein A/HamA C-terminal domain-containing protein n=1 Tax=Lactococcus lactis subsp. lactis TaxID=1360 RepID=A0A1V0NFZ8_LACLL|nr:DUF1837 domain-containing protein [Lactococcus garvieae]ARD98858.1 hypothetical protein LL275_1228 [Lactococcus lactis subsp. lactis]NHI69382.1 DUF1837 domain-containing protein [Lactococcus garvieae]NHJ06463.1 DUF1837 domain-containing protein [Lactococcus garvieae]OAZ17132.1 hypothetical protein V425_04225 [Lactococcus lactis RTB018]
MSDSYISPTIISGNFDNIFTEVEHSSSLGLINNNELRIFQLPLQDYAFRFDVLQEFIEDNIGRYVFSRSTIDGLKSEGKEETISFRAFKELLKKGQVDVKGTGQELGELLIYAFLEQVLHAPKLMSKVELNTLGEPSEIESIHLYSFTDNNIDIYQLIFGSSSIVGDLGEAIDEVRKSIIKIASTQKNQLQLIDANVLNSNFNEETAEKIKTLIIPQKRGSQSPESAYGIFLGYTLGLQSAGKTPRQFAVSASKKVRFDIEHCVQRLAEIINISGLAGYSFYVYVLPFNDAESDKKNIMKEVLGGG